MRKNARGICTVGICVGVFFFLASASAHAEFEGILHMKMTSERSTGTMDVYVSKIGLRQEIQNQINIDGQKHETRMTMLMKFKEQDKTYMLNEQNKTYSVMEASKLPKGAPAAKISTKPLGELTVGGYRCKNVLVTYDNKHEMEVCAAREIMNFSQYHQWVAMDPQNKDGSNMMKALKEAGADGFWVRMKTRPQRGMGGMTMELVKAEPKQISASVYEIPAGYKQQEGLMGAMGAAAPAMSAEDQKQMNEALKNMSPKQRAMVEKMIKGGGQ